MRPAPNPPFTQNEAPSIVWPLLEAARFGGDLEKTAKDVVGELGFEWFRWVVCHRDGPGLGADRDLLNDGPRGWPEVYRARNFRAADPLFREALRNGIPRIWDEETHRGNAAGNEIYEAAASFGMGHGVHIALHQAQPGSLNFFIVAAPERRMDHARKRGVVRAYPALWAVGIYGCKLISNVARPAQRREARRSRLSVRELECFKYVAQGMTSRDIGGLLGISERTVDAHIGHAIRRLGARNRREALTHAIACGELAV